MKHLKVRENYRQYSRQETSSENLALQNLEAGELEKRLTLALSKLPEKCRTVFQLCRFEELKYKEVAEQLNLPLKTVENEMGKALRLLRLSLADLLSLVLLTFHLL
ncbi:MAG: sigma-70 family RNA polymerase sigma factor [Leadbetterella sp.]|nr:sigma-70 family RNA polymerase sigma factor [Leadbetterella sp.]